MSKKLEEKMEGSGFFVKKLCLCMLLALVGFAAVKMIAAPPPPPQPTTPAPTSTNAVPSSPD